MKNRVLGVMDLMLAVLMVSITFAGCGNSPKNAGKRNNVFEQNSETGSSQEEEETKAEVSTSVRIKGMQKQYVYTGEDVVIPYLYEAMGSESVGIMILCDGIATPFHTQEEPEDKIFQVVSIRAGKEKEIDLHVIPYGKRGDKVCVEVVDVTDPAFDYQNATEQEIHDAFGMGGKYQVRYISGITVSMEKGGLSYNGQIATDYTSRSIKKNQGAVDDFFDEENIQELNADGTVQGERSDWYCVKQGDVLDLKIRYYGPDDKKIMTSVYVDGELYPAFRGKEYIQCPIRENEFSIVKGTIDTSALGKGRHVVFGACGSPEYNNTRVFWPFVLEVK